MKLPLGSNIFFIHLLAEEVTSSPEEPTCFCWAGQLPLEVCFGTLTSLLRLPAHPPSTTSSPENKPEGRLPPLKFPMIQVRTLEIPGFPLISLEVSLISPSVQQIF